MLQILGNQKRLCNGLTRREFVQAGSLGLFGLSLTDLLRCQELQGATTKVSGNAGKAKSCIVLFLYGAWSQLDTLDPKPDAPEEIRGEFKPIATSIPGLCVSELLPRVAGLMDRVTLVRSMSHPYSTHCVAYALSGIPENPERDPRTFWPFYGSQLDYLWARSGVRQAAGIPRNICLPWPLNSRSTLKSHRGLTTAWLGKQWETVFAEFTGQASRAEGAPSADGSGIRSRYDPFDGITPESTFEFIAATTSQSERLGKEHAVARSGLELPAELTLDRLNERRTLLEQFDATRRGLDKLAETRGYDRFQEMALDMITSPKVSMALDVTKEPAAVREKYGYTLFGQGALAARRLIEAGVRVATVYWDAFGPGTGWDTHVNNFPRLKEGLCPGLDQVYATLLEDLDQRGMLDETVVLLMSEHGRTPKISKVPGGGREHWSTAYCNVLAGAGIRRGAVVGATDKQAGAPASRPINPKDILATLYHLMGFDPHATTTTDQLGRPMPLVPYGEVVHDILV